MKPHSTILVVIALGGMAGGLFLLGDGGGRIGLRKDSPVSAPVLSVSRHREDPRTPSRFAGLDTALRKIVIQLEEANTEWSKGRPVPDWRGDQWNDWEAFSREKVSLLSTDQIHSLVTWLERADCPSSSAFEEYRSALFFVWAFRDHAACRSHLMEVARAQGIGEDFDFYQAGFAASDPSEAWRAYLRDVSDPQLQPKMGSQLAQVLFKAYSASNSREAWNLILKESDVRRCALMVEGYSYGAPTGQDWKALCDELSASLGARGVEIPNTLHASVAERWLTEDPVEALNWYIDHVSANKPSSPAEIRRFDGPEWAAELKRCMELRLQLGERLLSQMYDSTEHRTAPIMSALDRLLANGEEEIPAEFISKRVGASLSFYDTPLLQLIPKIQDSELRARLFLQVVHALPTQSSDPSVDPTEGDRVVRRLARDLDMPPNIRKEAEGLLETVEIRAKNPSSK